MNEQNWLSSLVTQGFLSDILPIGFSGASLIVFVLADQLFLYCSAFFLLLSLMDCYVLICDRNHHTNVFSHYEVTSATAS